MCIAIRLLAIHCFARQLWGSIKRKNTPRNARNASPLRPQLPFKENKKQVSNPSRSAPRPMHRLPGLARPPYERNAFICCFVTTGFTSLAFVFLAVSELYNRLVGSPLLCVSCSVSKQKLQSPMRQTVEVAMPTV